MAQLKTPEDYARIILKIMVDDFGLQPGKSLKQQSIMANWPEKTYAGITSGLQFGRDAGWFEDANAAHWVRLTDAGFAQARSSHYLPLAACSSFVS